MPSVKLTKWNKLKPEQELYDASFIRVVGINSPFAREPTVCRSSISRVPSRRSFFLVARLIDRQAYRCAEGFVLLREGSGDLSLSLLRDRERVCLGAAAVADKRRATRYPGPCRRYNASVVRPPRARFRMAATREMRYGYEVAFREHATHRLATVLHPLFFGRICDINVFLVYYSKLSFNPYVRNNSACGYIWY